MERDKALSELYSLIGKWRERHGAAPNVVVAYFDGAAEDVLVARPMASSSFAWISLKRLQEKGGPAFLLDALWPECAAAMRGKVLSALKFASLMKVGA